MATLSELKGSEVRLRESLKGEMIPSFKQDIRYAYRFVRVRVRLAERKAGIISRKE